VGYGSFSARDPTGDTVEPGRADEDGRDGGWSRAARVPRMLRLRRRELDAICALAYREYPLEMCGLIAAAPGADGVVERFYPCRNDAESAKVYTVAPLDFVRAEDAADAEGWEICGVVHSHTHSEPYPSPTDVTQAVDPAWHYLIVSLKRDAPELRSYRITDGRITEEPIELT
jgi:proteasome lid subunit RPN8/RPN11